jgi:hypothetical protein
MGVSGGVLPVGFVLTSINADGGKDNKDLAPQTDGLIFIQASMLDSFKKKALPDKEKYTIVVDTDFQYGQKDKTGKGRFLVYQDKEFKIFQVSSC